LVNSFVRNTLLPSVLWGIIVNCAYLSYVIFNVPVQISIILLPILAGAYLCWFSSDLKSGFISTVIFIAIMLFFMYFSLSMPLYLGVFSDTEYMDIFNFMILLSVLRNILVIVFFTFISYIVTFFIKGD